MRIKAENIHIVFWLLKDLSWVLLWKELGLIMALPTIALAFIILYRSWDNAEDRWHNMAVCFWILANSLWMFGEFYLADGLRLPASCLFIGGLLVLLPWYGARLLMGFKGKS